MFEEHGTLEEIQNRVLCSGSLLVVRLGSLVEHLLYRQADAIDLVANLHTRRFCLQKLLGGWLHHLVVGHEDGPGEGDVVHAGSPQQRMFGLLQFVVGV